MDRKSLFALTIVTVLIATVPSASADEPKAVIHRVTSHLGWDANAFIVETPDAVFIVDALFLQPDVHALADRIERIGKPVEGLLLTHPHPDHYGGFAVLRERLGDFPIYASAAAIADIPANFEQFKAGPAFGGGLGTPAFDSIVLPDHTVSDGDTLMLAGLEIRVVVMGPGESADSTVFEMPGQSVSFIGDIVMPYHHQYVGEGRAIAALAQMRALQERSGDFARILSGHGDNAPPAVLAEGIEYLDALIAATDAAMADPANRGEDGHLLRPARRAAMEPLLQRFAALSHFDFGTQQMLGWNMYGREAEILAAERAAAD